MASDSPARRLKRRNAAVLVIGSLAWDPNPLRAEWRLTLDWEDAAAVRVPIRYARSSSTRGDTFTMTFSVGARGVALLVPLKLEIRTTEDLASATRALWRAESPTAVCGATCAPWGRTAVRFGRDAHRQRLAADWEANCLRQKCPTLDYVGQDGSLRLPMRSAKGILPAYDFILATPTLATHPDATVDQIADAWCDQDEGFEEYFLQNLAWGIQTLDDIDLLLRIAHRKPAWIESWPGLQQLLDNLPRTLTSNA